MSVGETPAGSPVRGRQSQEWVHRAHRLFRAGIRAVLRSSNDIEIVAKAANGREALRLVAAHRPEVVPRGWLVLVATAAR